jgi:catechol 2,3-dioxygenase-like lactoylglutathione lyase family enzyme
MSPEAAPPVSAGVVLGFDHVALPMQHVDAMVTFYRSLGFDVQESPHLVQVRMGDQMINFHRPELWERGFALRAPAAVPPCGDICLVWEGSVDSLADHLHQAGAEVIEGPVEREGGRGVTGVSHYVRDPDGNLLEFMRYSATT